MIDYFRASKISDKRTLASHILIYKELDQGKRQYSKDLGWKSRK